MTQRLKRALEGIDHEEAIEEIEGFLKKLKRSRIDEQQFWAARTEALEYYAISDPLFIPSGVTIESMPLFLAHAWKQYAEEHHPRVKLHLMLEFVELAVRFSVAVLISQIRRDGNNDTLPEDLTNVLSQLIRNPTLGQWLGILRSLASHQPESAPLPELFSLYAQLDADTWLSNKDKFSEDQSILVLRNNVAHGGGFSNRKASEWLAAHQKQVEAMLKTILDALGDARFVSADNRLLLMGDKPSGLDDAEMSADVTGCRIQLGDISMPLWPLVNYAIVKRFDENGQIKSASKAPTAQIYAALNKNNLHFTPLGVDACLSQSSEIETFRTLFALDRKSETNRQGDAYHREDFLMDAVAEAEQLVGRADQISALKKWVKRDTRNEDTCRALWLHGKAGMGKSMLIARAVKDWASGANGSNKDGLFYHRFRAGDGRNSLRMFMKLLQQTLWAWSSLQTQTQAPNLQLEGDKLLEDIQQRLGCVASLQAKQDKSRAPRYLLVVDGLDEVIAHEPKLMETLKKMLLPGVMLVASSRDEQGLGKFMQELGAETLFPYGLAPLNAHEVRAMLENDLRSASMLKCMAKFDSQNTPTDQIPENRYILKVLEASQGLPLYVHLLVDDLKTGKRKLEDDQLPESLRAYYDEIMNRIGLSDVRRDLTEIIALLAVAHEPLERDAVAQFLAGGESDWMEYVQRVDSAIEAGSSLLRISKSKDNGDGYTTYHQSYREYLLEEASPIKAANLGRS